MKGVVLAVVVLAVVVLAVLVALNFLTHTWELHTDGDTIWLYWEVEIPHVADLWR